MGNAKFWLLLLELCRVVIAEIRTYRDKKRADAVRTDPAGEWLRKFGGTDQRNKDASTGPEDAGGGGN
ncbi:hypothetical protein [uncultured Desulfovibrio sp.]|uniref:hypothetical protein n=1 Tax=uncultured Desulfovibrio sp. TaxID=167968 RepID=UPI0026244397|nr:hypothetical protein [uncultured Desulfovibrio sp.]